MAVNKEPESPDEGNKKMQIKLYSTPDCPYCRMVKDFLTQRKVKFETINVAANQAAAEYLVKKTDQIGVPVTIISAADGTEKIIVGFNLEELASALK